MSLARALYQQSELFLLDDFLSALDPKVARKVLNQMRSLESMGKSLVISINNLSLIKDSDRVIWLENGQVSFDGAWKDCELHEKDLGFNIDVNKPQAKNSNKQSENTLRIEKDSSVTELETKTLKAPQPKSSTSSKDSASFFVQEDRQTGGLTCAVFNRMVDALGGWFLFILIIVMTMIAFVFIVIFTLNSVKWAEDFKNGKDTSSLEKQILLLSFLAAILTAVRAIVYYVKGASMSRKIHSKMTFKVLHAPLIELLQRMPFG